MDRSSVRSQCYNCVEEQKKCKACTILDDPTILKIPSDRGIELMDRQEKAMFDSIVRRSEELKAEFRTGGPGCFAFRTIPMNDAIGYLKWCEKWDAHTRELDKFMAMPKRVL